MSSAEELFAAEQPSEDQYIYVESFGTYLTRDGKTFTNKEDMLAYLNGAAIRAWVDAYLAHVEANPEKYFTKAAKKERVKRDGTVIPAKEGGIIDPKVQTILKGKMRSMAADVVAFMLSQNAE